MRGVVQHIRQKKLYLWTAKFLKSIWKVFVYYSYYEKILDISYYGKYNSM